MLPVAFSAAASGSFFRLLCTGRSGGFADSRMNGKAEDAYLAGRRTCSDVG